MERINDSWLGPIHLNQSPDSKHNTSEYKPLVHSSPPCNHIKTNPYKVISDLRNIDKPCQGEENIDEYDEDEDEVVHDLVELERKVKAGRISSVLSLHLHFVNLVKTSYIPGPRR